MAGNFYKYIQLNIIILLLVVPVPAFAKKIICNGTIVEYTLSTKYDNTFDATLLPHIKLISESNTTAEFFVFGDILGPWVSEDISTSFTCTQQSLNLVATITSVAGFIPVFSIPPAPWIPLIKITTIKGKNPLNLNVDWVLHDADGTSIKKAITDIYSNQIYPIHLETTIGASH